MCIDFLMPGRRVLPCLFHLVALTSLWIHPGKDFDVTRAAMDGKTSCALRGGALLLLVLSHMTAALEVPLD
ncbi:hypothetical protein DNTS_030085, partial [Danionella cerebrum]